MSVTNTYDKYSHDIAALGLDPAHPVVSEDDPRFEQVAAILELFGGSPPAPPLPAGWQGRCPLGYEPTLGWLTDWLENEQRKLTGDQVFCGSRNVSLLHLNTVIANTFRALADFGVEDLPKHPLKATTIPQAADQIASLHAFVRRRIRAEAEATAVPAVPAASVPLGDMAIGIDMTAAGIAYYLFSPCPDPGERIRLRKAISLPLAGQRWLKVLDCYARSKDGRTARNSDLTHALGYMKTGEMDAERAQFSEHLTCQEHPPRKRLRQTMADLSREFRQAIKADGKLAVFESRQEFYVAAYVVRELCRDADRNIRFGKAI